jgi:hypothetical protein
MQDEWDMALARSVDVFVLRERVPEYETCAMETDDHACVAAHTSNVIHAAEDISLHGKS